MSTALPSWTPSGPVTPVGCGTGRDGSQVPPTAGLVAKFFGTANMATLFGIVMLTHQVGGFLGAWLGGKVFEATGSYDWMWYMDIVLAAGAALIHLPIREAPMRRPAVAAST